MTPANIQRTRRVMLLAATCVVSTTSVWADAGLPMLILAWPSMIVLLIPIIIVEAAIAQRLLNTSWSQSIRLSALTNSVSTLVGIPLSWFVLLLLELGAGTVLGALDPHGQWSSILVFPLFAAWIAPPQSTAAGWLAILAAGAVLCFPFFYMSVLIEYRVGVLLMGAELRTELRSWSWRANLISYGAILIGLLVALGILWVQVRPNNAMNLTVRPVTRLAVAPSGNSSKGDGQGARPSRPAGYRGRYAALSR